MDGLRVGEVAERLGLGENAVYQLLASGRLGSYRVGPRGGRHLISEAHLAAYLESCEGGARAKAATLGNVVTPPAYGCRGRAERLDGKPLKHY